MTAYGHAINEDIEGRIVVEIQSVNRKHLEIQLNLPKGFQWLDVEIRKKISAVINRGQITIRITISGDQVANVKICPNLSLVRQVSSASLDIAKELKMDADKIFLTLLSSQSDILQTVENVEQKQECRKAVEEALEIALASFNSMRILEGKALEIDISNRLKFIEESFNSLIKLAPEITEKYRKKLLDTYLELGISARENEESLLRDLVLATERLDISEEIVRFQSHLIQFLKTLQDLEPVGKKIEFLLQEMNREINTVGSKLQSQEVSKLVIEIKTQLERIREQIQNVE